MPATTDYLATLKIQLDAAAANKKAALDAAYERATNVQFDTEGKMSTRQTPAKNDAAPGTLDVQYAEQQRNIGSSNEASGTLKSGQYGRELATSQAGYRSTIAGLAAETASGKTAADTEAASELAKYKAMYGTPTPDATPTTGGGGTSGGTGGTGGGGGGGTQKPTDPTDNAPVTAPPIFVDPNAINQNKQVTSNKPSNNFNEENLLQLNRPTSTIPAKPQNNRVTSPVTKKPVVTPPKKLVPVSNKIKTIKVR